MAEQAQQMTLQELEKLGRQYLDDKKKGKTKEKKSSPKYSYSNRRGWIKGVAFAIVSTGEVAVEAAVAANEIKEEVRHQRAIRAGRRLLVNMENAGYIDADYTVAE